MTNTEIVEGLKSLLDERRCADIAILTACELCFKNAKTGVKEQDNKAYSDMEYWSCRKEAIGRELVDLLVQLPEKWEMVF